MSSDPNEPLLLTATRLHLAGRLMEAEALYRALLAQRPDHADALHRLGMVAYQNGCFENALTLVDQAIVRNPEAYSYHSHRGMILLALSRIDEAIASYRQALQLTPCVPDVLNNLAVALEAKRDTEGAIGAYREALRAQPDFPQASANLGLIYLRAGQFADAVQIFRAALAQQPNDAELNFHLGNALHSSGFSNEAIAALREAVSLRPEWAAAHNNLGVALRRAEEREAALACFERALALKPEFAEAHFNRGEALASCRQPEAAIAAYRHAIALEPLSPQSHNNLGICLGALGRFDEAISCFRHALKLFPGYSEAHNNLGNVLKAAGRGHEAIFAYRSAVELRPDDAAVWNNLGCALLSQGDVDEALTVLRRAIDLQPDFAEAYDNLGSVLKERAELDAALAAYRRALDLRPDCQETHSNYLYTLNFHPGYSREQIYREHKRWNAAYAAPLRSGNPAYSNDLSCTRRLRVGYVAPDFREHCQSMFTLPLFSHHDHNDFEVIAYSSVAARDGVTEQLRGYCDGWRDILSLTDQAAADLIREDKIDILVDLTLHMARNRLFVFARKPAPVQVSWLGYPGTTGLTAMDYRLTDPYLDPPSEANDACYSERTVRLPDTFWCYDPRASEPAVKDLPSSQNRYITFGCLNNFCKVSDPSLRLWAAVMRSISGSKLILLAPGGGARERVLGLLKAEGIEGDRVEFVERRPRSHYLALYHRIDLGLDTIPYNGHTTTLDSLWMGVPVLTLVGETPAGRAGWSQLCNLGLKHLAATSERDYIKIAQQVAADLPGLAVLRRELRDRMRRSPLMDAARFARNIEVVYRRMWEDWIVR